MRQGIRVDLERLEFELSVIEDGWKVDYAVRLEDEGYRVRRSVSGTYTERYCDNLTSLELLYDVDAWIWFARGFKGIPLRFIERRQDAARV